MIVLCGEAVPQFVRMTIVEHDGTVGGVPRFELAAAACCL